MRRRAQHSAGCLAFLALVAALAPAAAKDVRVRPHVATASPEPMTSAESTKLARALSLDALALGAPAPTRRAGAPTLVRPLNLDVRRSNHEDGSSTVTVVQPLSRHRDFEVGADFNVAARPATTYEPDKQYPGAAKDNTGGAAWASLGVTRYAKLDARIEPGTEQATLGATFEKSVPLAGDVSLTLRGRYTASDRLTGGPADQDTAPVLSTDHTARFNIASSGTSLSAGVHANSTDPVMHNTLSADQQLYGPLHVTTAITDAGQPTSNKSVTASINLTW